MTYFQFMETMWVERQKLLQVPPEQLKETDQARFTAVAWLLHVSRKLVMYYSVVGLLVAFLAIKLRLKKAPEFKSSIPPAPPTAPAKPTLVA